MKLLLKLKIRSLYLGISKFFPSKVNASRDQYNTINRLNKICKYTVVLNLDFTRQLCPLLRIMIHLCAVPILYRMFVTYGCKWELNFSNQYSLCGLYRLIHDRVYTQYAGLRYVETA